MNQTEVHRLLAGKALDRPEKANLGKLYEKRLAANFTLIQDLYFSLYPERDDAFRQLLDKLGELYAGRPEELKLQDAKRLKEGNWYQSGNWVGTQLYVDRYNRNLNGLEARIPYLEKLGVNLLHLMPLTTRPDGPNDGGYAVNSYTDIDPRYGTRQDLLSLGARLREEGMCLMLDFVVNHTSDEFPWAQKAKAGDPRYLEYYYTYPDRTIPDLYEQTLPEIFPESAPGNFTYVHEMQRWVMTVFNTYQWDLNYTNPEVFREMLANLTQLVNLGVDVVRFDALAFLWKRIGTSSQNLPEAHRLIALFRLCLQVVAPGAVILAEAIVAPREIVRYFGEGVLAGNECEIAYNATFMACLWNSVATTKTRLLYKSVLDLPEVPKAASWINYIRCHDDIGLGFDDRHIRELGWDPQAHRRFLLDYYCQRLDWSPAKGAVFMYNPITGDGRITGSTASLLGLEKALEDEDEAAAETALLKILLLHGIIMAAEGIPLIYAGDEIGMLNDYSYLGNPAISDDSRWVNRPYQDWDTVGKLDSEPSYASRIFNRLASLIALRRSLPVAGGSGNTRYHLTGNDHLFAMERYAPGQGLMVLANFDASPQVMNASWLGKLGYIKDGRYHNRAFDQTASIHSGLLELPPYTLIWLTLD